MSAYAQAAHFFVKACLHAARKGAHTGCRHARTVQSHCRIPGCTHDQWRAKRHAIDRDFYQPECDSWEKTRKDEEMQGKGRASPLQATYISGTMLSA